MSAAEYGVRLAEDLKSRGLGPLAAFLVRANWPLATIYANVVMGAEPFAKLAGYNVAPLYEMLNDRDALRAALAKLEEE